MQRRFSLFQGGDGAAPQGLASTLLRCHSIDEMRHLAPLPKDSQELIDNAVVQVGLDRLVLVADLLTEGLTFPIPDPLSVMEVVWEKEALIGSAIRTMSPSARGERQLPDRKIERIPIYATIDDFSFDARLLRSSQRAGTPIDVSMVEQATRRVNESIEDSAINGAGITVTGNDAPGILNAPGANTITIGTTWDSATGEQILSDVLAAADELHDVNRFGPYNLYIPTSYGNALNADFKANSDKTIRMRLEELEFGGRNLRIRVADFLPADTISMIQMTSDIIDVISGQQPTSVSWQDGPGWTRFFAVIAFMIPRVKTDYDGNTGIVNGTL